MKRSHVVSAMLVILVCLCLLGADSAPEANSRIAGKVINQRGQGMPQLLVKLMIPRGLKDHFPTTQPLKGGKNPYLEGTTNQNGEFVFEKLPAGEYALTSELEGTGRGRVEITLGKNQSTNVQIVLKARRGETQ